MKMQQRPVPLKKPNYSGELYFMLLVTCAAKPLASISRNSMNQNTSMKNNRKSIEIISNSFKLLSIITKGIKLVSQHLSVFPLVLFILSFYF